jgi:DNA-binding PadR family transcriptional regulator
LADLARKVDWTLKTGEQNKMKVQRKLKRLVKHKLVTNDRDQWSVTEKGKKALKRNWHRPGRIRNHSRKRGPYLSER